MACTSSEESLVRSEHCSDDERPYDLHLDDSTLCKSSHLSASPSPSNIGQLVFLSCRFHFVLQEYARSHLKLQKPGSEVSVIDYYNCHLSMRVRTTDGRGSSSGNRCLLHQLLLQHLFVVCNIVQLFSRSRSSFHKQTGIDSSKNTIEMLKKFSPFYIGLTATLGVAVLKQVNWIFPSQATKEKTVNGKTKTFQLPKFMVAK